MKYVILILCLFIGVGCSPYRRFQRLIKKNPEFIQTRLDTMYSTVTDFDTFFYNTTTLDTFWSYDTTLKLKVVYITKKDTIFKTIKPKKAQNIVITKKEYIQTPDKNAVPWYVFYILGLITFVILWMIFH